MLTSRDVLLACKSQGTPALPPPSPMVASVPIQPLPEQPQYLPTTLPDLHLVPVLAEPSGVKARLAALEARAGLTSPPPVQKIGDAWVAASVIGGSSDVSARKTTTGVELRNSVQRMFDTGPDTARDLSIVASPTRRESAVDERIRAWQPGTQDAAALFSRNNSQRSQAVGQPIRVGDFERENGFPKSETGWSFDPNDLNPSRSASQVRRASTLLGGEEPVRRYGPKPSLPSLEEKDSDGGSGTQMEKGAPTHISHVTFPKPTVAGERIPAFEPMPVIPSATNSSVETEETSLKTPRTATSVTSHSSADPTVLAKLEAHTTDHGSLAKQIDGVHVNIKEILATLTPASLETRIQNGTRGIDTKLDTLQLDVKGIGSALQLANLAQGRRPAEEMVEPKLPEVQQKLDRIVQICEDLLAKYAAAQAENNSTAPESTQGTKTVGSALAVEGRPATAKPSGLAVRSGQAEEEKQAGEEVAQIMADVVSCLTRGVSCS